MKTLESLDCWKGTPVDSIDVENSDGSQKTGNTVSKKTDGDCAQDDSGGAQWQVVEKILGREDHAGSGTV